MQIISEEIVGGEIVEKDEGLFSCSTLFLGNSAGDVSIKEQITKYSTIFQIPYTLKVIECLEPSKDKNGNSKYGTKGHRSYTTEVRFPVNQNGIEGFISLPVYSERPMEYNEEFDHQIALAIGAALLDLKMKKCGY